MAKTTTNTRQAFYVGALLDASTCDAACTRLRAHVNVSFTWDHDERCTIFKPSRDLGVTKYMQAKAFVDGIACLLCNPTVGQSYETPTVDGFAADFEAAYNKLQKNNSCHIYHLRHHLAQYDREAFDAGLYQLRCDGLYSMSAAESSSNNTPHMIAAGITEGSATLVHVSKR